MSPNLIAYVGLTHLGLISAAATLEKGFQVMGFDPDETLVTHLKSSTYPINEPGFAEALHKNKDKICFTSCLEDLRKADLIYIAPDIPTDDRGNSDLSGIKKLITLIAPYVSKSACLVILSQVPPGFTRSLSSLLNNSSLEPENIYYQVETLVFGIAMDRALYPERFIVGAYHPQKPLNSHLETFLNAFKCPLLIMNYESAEFCKICINAFLAATVSTTNTLEDVCQKIGAKWSDIIPALRLDKRIGPYAYLSPGLGLAGGNIERDLNTIVSLAQNHGSHGNVIDGFIKNSQHRRNWPLNVFYNKILPHLSGQDVTIGILGLAYKENTHSTKNSPALRLISQLQGFKIHAYDPLVKALPFEAASLILQPTCRDVIENSDVLFLMTPWDEFKTLPHETILPLMNKKFVVDPYKLLSMDTNVAFTQDIIYYSLC